MKTTFEVPDSVYRQVKARAAVEGKTVKAFLLEALREKLSGKHAGRSAEFGWRSVFGKAPRQAIRELQDVIDEEFSRIDSADWQ